MASDLADRRSGRPLIGVGAVILTPDHQRVLLIERGTPPALGRWSLPGGLVERGESLREACAREVREETGLRIAPREEVKIVERVIEAADGTVQRHYLIVDFVALDAGEREPRAGSDVTAAAWVPIDQLASLPTTLGLAEAITRAREVLRGQAPSSALLVQLVTRG